jgi:glycine betaine catabolism B
MKTIIDNALNQISMYRLTLYYVAVLLLAAFGLGLFGIGPHDANALAFSAVFIGGVCWTTNRLLAAAFRVPVNVESIYITALILVLIMPPVVASDTLGLAGMAMAAIVAIASKFLLAINRKHVFNPVAIGVFVSAFVLDQPATWWIGGNLALLPLVLILGVLVVRKVQRFEMVITYILADLAITLATATPDMYGEALSQALLYSPLLFAGFAMLTEPLTAPQGKLQGIAFGAIVGLLSAPNMHIGEYYFTPESAFLVGNVFAFAVSPKYRFKLTLVRIEKMASGCYDFIFKPDRRIAFKAGQYLDWTLAVRNPDNRGNRRPFTIASAPSDNEVRLGVKFYQAPSAFKRALLAMKPGDVLFGSQIAGSFTLPKDKTKKFAFIAGGIGVTPFCSMIQDMINRHEAPPVVMFYGNNSITEIAYADLLDRAERELGIKTVYAVVENAKLDTNMHHGFIDAALIQREMPDFRERTFYISGPRSMVLGFQGVLKELGIARSQIKVDFFPGFA